MGIRSKILLAMVLSILLSISGLLATAYYEMNIVFVDNFKTNSNAQLHRMNAFIENFFNNARSMVEYIASEEVTVNNIENISNYLHINHDHTPIGEELPDGERDLYHDLLAITENFPIYLFTYVGNSTGGFTQAPDYEISAGYVPYERPWYTDVVKKNGTVLTEAYVDISGDVICTIAAPIRNDRREIRGVASVDITLENITKETGSVNVGKTGYVLLFDTLKQVVSDPKNSASHIPEQNRWLGKEIKDLPGDASKVMNELYNLKNGYKEVEIDGKIWLTSVQTTKDGWVLIMLQERDEVFQGAMSVTLHIAVAGLIIGIVLLIVAWLVANSIANPIIDLSKASRAVAEGDIHAIPQDDSLFTGELSILHKSLKTMVDKLGELIETANIKIKESEHSLETSRQALLNAEEAKKQGESARREGILYTAEQIGEIVQELTSSMSTLAEEAKLTSQHATKQKGRVENAANAITEMSTVVADVAQTTSRTANLAEDTRLESEKGKELVFKLVDSMKEIERKALSMQKSLGSLQGQANDINQIMSMINDVADQTNLLALNAAIEAARAGEAGRGFAVVADEVRKLAEKTMESTKQVYASISNIQKGTEENIHAIEDTVNYVTQSTAVANNAGEALAGIEEMIKNTAEEVRSIATASEEQSATLKEINTSTDEIHDITLSVSESSIASNQAVSQLMNITSNLENIVENLKRENT